METKVSSHFQEDLLFHGILSQMAASDTASLCSSSSKTLFICKYTSTSIHQISLRDMYIKSQTPLTHNINSVRPTHAQATSAI